jgi:pre-mRNA-splicing factor CWC22
LSLREEILNVFKHDPDYEANEEKYQAIKRELLEESSDGGKDSGSSSSEEDSDDDKSVDEDKELAAPILDQTETNLIALRRTIYLTIQVE